MHNFLFYFKFDYRAPWGTEPHVALLRRITYAFCVLMSMGPNTSAFYPHSQWPSLCDVYCGEKWRARR
jgi:hypothetical protein